MSNLPRITIFGGSGFLGTQICKAATQKGWNVTSLSRSGEPSWPDVSSTSAYIKPSWASQVQWIKANIFEPNTYSSLLEETDAVVHTMGILLENDYKRIMNGNASPLQILSKSLMNSGAGRGESRQLEGNPLLKVDRGPMEERQRLEEQGKHVREERTPKALERLTYERLNRDSATILAQSFLQHSKSNQKTFCYVSAAGGFPMLPQRYITTKREAEQLIGEMHGLRTLFIRPGFLYSPNRGITMSLSYAMSATSMLNKASGGVLSGILGGAGHKPLDTEIVGQAVIRAIVNGLSGVVETKDIERLGTEVWREGML